VKHRRPRAGLASVATRSNYRIAATSAAFLAVAATTGALMTPSTGQRIAADEIPVAAAQAAIGVSVPAAEVAPPSPPVAASQPAPPPAQRANPDLAPTPAPPAPPAAKELNYTYQGQPNFYYCGPAATRIALTARKLWPSQDDVAARLNTTVNGTNSAVDTTRVLNSLTGNFYRTREIPGAAATPAEMDRLQADAVRAISNGYAIVANVVGDATDTAGGWHGYPGGHYVAIVGYQDSGRRVKVADPANPSVSSYWMTTIEMANWMAQRGYSG
jgi:hypothetical protein